MENITTTETLFHAQPHDPSAMGFYFKTYAEYRKGVTECRNSHGAPVEEFEIQFIDGDDLDAALFNAMGIHQGNITLFMEKTDTWDDNEKIRLIIGVGECGYAFDMEQDDPNDLDIDLYPDMTLIELAQLFVDEGLFGDIPERLASYLDYEAIARDLAFDYAETTIAGSRFIYRCS